MPRSDNRQQSDITPFSLNAAAPFSLSQTTKGRIERLARKQLQNFPRLNDPAIFGDNVGAGYKEGPILFLEDHRGIDLTPDDRVAIHEYRTMALARNGDFLLTSQPRHNAFERYSNEIFGRENLNIIAVDRGDVRMRKTLAAACLENEHALSQLVAAATDAGTINICPYLSCGYDWLLGAEIARRSACPVQICAPLPQLSSRVNDKLWFSNQAKQILGQDSVPPTYSVYGPVAAAAILNKLARTYNRLVIKLPASAGSMGNLVLDSEYIRSLTIGDLRAELIRRLHAIGWHNHFPILVGVWEIAALASPSAQIWIPKASDGPPIIEGIFGQILSGENQCFIGATEIILPELISQQFYREALEIGYYFQCLGYFGRMSLDALLTGKNMHEAKLHWIECNGRWGGVSIPMTAARNLAGLLKSKTFLVVQRMVQDIGIESFDDLLKDISPLMFNKTTGEGIVFLEPVDKSTTNIAFFVIASSPELAEQIGVSVLNAISPQPPGSTP